MAKLHELSDLNGEIDYFFIAPLFLTPILLTWKMKIIITSFPGPFILYLEMDGEKMRKNLGLQT